MPSQEKMYTTQQAAEMLGISDSRLRTLIVEGRAHPKEQLGGTWFFTLDEIERLRTTRRPRGRPKKQ